MVRRPASLVALLPLLLAVGLAMSLAQAPRFPDVAPRFTAPCEPASPGLQCEQTAKMVSKTGFAAAVVVDEAAAAAEQSREGLAALPVRLLVAVTFPPAFRRPPPFNS